MFAHSGGLFTYGPRLSESFKRLAYYTARILKGAKPSELPVESPTQFELVINLKTARQSGLLFQIPSSLSLTKLLSNSLWLSFSPGISQRRSTTPPSPIDATDFSISI